MKPAEIIRLAVIGIGLLFGYYSVVNVVEFIGRIPRDYSVSESKATVSLLLRAVCFLVGFYLLIKHNRKISVSIDEGFPTKKRDGVKNV